MHPRIEIALQASGKLNWSETWINTALLVRATTAHKRDDVEKAARRAAQGDRSSCRGLSKTASPTHKASDSFDVPQ